YQQAEKDRERRPRQISSRGQAERQGRDEDHQGNARQQPWKAPAPAAVEQQPQRTRFLLRLAHSRPGSSASDAMVGMPSGGGSAACAVQMTARIPTARGPS